MKSSASDRIQKAAAASKAPSQVVSRPIPALGLFIAGVLSTEMSTLDSYCLVAGGNVAYDIYKPALKPDATDTELIKTTRYGILMSWFLGFAMAVSF